MTPISLQQSNDMNEVDPIASKKIPSHKEALSKVFTSMVLVWTTQLTSSSLKIRLCSLAVHLSTENGSRRRRHSMFMVNLGTRICAHRNTERQKQNPQQAQSWAKSVTVHSRTSKGPLKAQMLYRKNFSMAQQLLPVEHFCESGMT